MRAPAILALLLLSPGVACPEPVHDVVSDIGLVYRRIGTRALVLDLYRPRDAAPELRPAVLLIHGGSWSDGDRWQLAGCARDLAGRGFVAATVEYRRSGEARFPAPVADVRGALRFLAANGARFGLDPRRIGVFGPSAGGHLALMLATLPRAAHEPAVSACAAWAAPADLVRGMTEGDVVPRESLEVVERFLGGPLATHARRWVAASPATRVTRDTPPLFLAHGERDAVVPISQARYLVEAAELADADVTLVRVPDIGHELCENAADPRVRAAWERTVSFFARRLGPASSVRADAAE